MEDLKAICKLYSLKILTLRDCDLQEIPGEIGNLTQLRYLDFYRNSSLKELPRSLCELHELRSLNVSFCSLSGLPQGTQRLAKLKHLFNTYAFQSSSFPSEALGQLTGLQTLSEFKGRLGYLNNLNHIRGEFNLSIEEVSGSKEDVDEAREAELKKKVNIGRLILCFANGNGGEIAESVLDALEPHQNLDYLPIESYKGSKLANWITSPLNQVREIRFSHLSNLTYIPSLGNLPCLEALELTSMHQFESVGLDFLGMTTKQEEAKDIHQSSATIVRFPMLKTLRFCEWIIWKEWEDITEAEEEAASKAKLSLFPSLKELHITRCPNLTELPHRLLRRASSLEMLNVRKSSQLWHHYETNKESFTWSFISDIPHVEISPI